ncbi:hypothetical protein VHEMI06956 [[Torrubiella] hemipterigena]|uniref:LysM domain-containing protein n=1 Tax=[Torrubiella] hemipterigena TaxID=1531966 RepID=A0A0A1TM29_9HYPO|nr:hypothetical protein VHEMI06956 [[Torrubiella] hemipterigena]
MQGSPYSGYDNQTIQQQYKYTATTCGKNDAVFDPTPGGFHPNNTLPPDNTCISHKRYITKDGDSCDSIALGNNVSSAALFWINPQIQNCTSILPKQTLCLPLSCPSLYKVKPEDSCIGIATANTVTKQSLLSWNPALNQTCANLQSGVWGSVLCVAQTPQPVGSNNGTSLDPWTGGNGIVTSNVTAPTGSSIADKTTPHCGGWYTAIETDSCASICIKNGVTYPIFLGSNPSLHDTSCDKDLAPGKAYCVHPSSTWNVTMVDRSTWEFSNQTFGGSLGFANFNNQKLGPLTAETHGQFTTDTRKLVITSRAYTKLGFDDIWSDSTLEGDVDIKSASGAAGFFFRSSNVTDGHYDYDEYFVGLSNRGYIIVTIHSRANGSDTLATVKAPDITQKKGQHHLKIHVAADTIQVYLNDIKTAKVKVNDKTYTQGTVGIRAASCENCTFDNIRLAPLQDSEIAFDFADGTLSGWETANTDLWSAASRAFVGKSSDGGRILSPKTISGDITLEADLILPTSSNSNAGFIFNVTEAGPGATNFQGYYVGFDVSGSVSINQISHASKELTSTRYNNYQADSVFHVMIRATQISISVFIDDMQTRVLTTPITGSPLAGQFGIAVHNTDVTVKNLYAYPSLG